MDDATHTKKNNILYARIENILIPEYKNVSCKKGGNASQIHLYFYQDFLFIRILLLTRIFYDNFTWIRSAWFLVIFCL